MSKRAVLTQSGPPTICPGNEKAGYAERRIEMNSVFCANHCPPGRMPESTNIRPSGDGTLGLTDTTANAGVASCVVCAGDWAAKPVTTAINRGVKRFIAAFDTRAAISVGSRSGGPASRRRST
jgi:hypothetical protein